MSIYPHRLLAFSQTVRPGEGSSPTWSYNGKAAVTPDQSGRERYAGFYALMHDRKHLCHLGKARGRIEPSMIVTYFQCLTLRVRSGHLSNALTGKRSWLTEKLVSPPYQSQSVVDSFTYYKKKTSSDPTLGQQYNR